MAQLIVSFKTKANFFRTIMRSLKSCGVPKKVQVLKKLRKDYDFYLLQLPQLLIGCLFWNKQMMQDLHEIMKMFALK